MRNWCSSATLTSTRHCFQTRQFQGVGGIGYKTSWKTCRSIHRSWMISRTSNRQCGWAGWIRKLACASPAAARRQTSLETTSSSTRTSMLNWKEPWQPNSHWLKTTFMKNTITEPSWMDMRISVLNPGRGDSGPMCESHNDISYPDFVKIFSF